MADLDLDYDLPSTWQGRMDALANGVIDFDDWEKVAMSCAAIADKEVFRHNGHIIMDGVVGETLRSWSSVVPQLLEDLLRVASQDLHGSEQWKVLCDQLVKCGAEADRVEGTRKAFQ